MLYQFKNPDRSRYRCQLLGQPGFIAHGHQHSQHLSAQQVVCLVVKGWTWSAPASPRRPRARAPAARSPRCASHQAVPAHGVQSGESAYNYLMQIADGHFISIDAEAPLTWCGVAFVPLQRGMAGLLWSLNASPRAWSGEVLSKVSYIKVENIKLKPLWDSGLKRKLENRISAS